MNATEGPGPAPAGKQKKKDILSDVLLGALEEIRTPDLLIRSQTLYPTELPAQVQDIYYHRHRGLSTVFSKKNEFFSRRKKSRRKPRFAAASTLTFGPGAPAAPSLPNAGMAFSSPPEAARLFPYSFSGRNCLLFHRQTPPCPSSPAGRCSARFPLPGTGPVRLSRRWAAQALPCARKESAPLPCSPLLPGAETGLHPRQKQKARPPPKGWPDRCVSLSGDEAQVSDQVLGLPNWQSLLPESEVHISSMFRGSL